MSVPLYPSTVAQRVRVAKKPALMCPRDFSVVVLTAKQYRGDVAVPCGRCGLMLRGYGSTDVDPPERMGEGVDYE